MKYKIGLIAAVAAGILVAVSGTLFAGIVTLPHTFASGTPALASDMNENFAAVKTAVDDNNTRLTAVETKLQTAGAVSVSMHGFTELLGHSVEAMGSSCRMNRILNYIWFDNANVGCTATAAVALPHGATLQGLSCLVYDNAPGTPPNIAPVLARMNLTTGAIEVVFSITSASADTGLQTLSSTTPQVSAVVDNNSFAYFINVDFDTTGSPADNLRLHGCKVGYQA